MRVQDLPPPSRFTFWCTAPFLLATFVLLPLLAQPPEASGWIAVFAVELLVFCVFLGLWDADRFWWCWRIVGAIVCFGYVAYLVSMALAGQWIGNGRPGEATAVHALLGLLVFGYPGFMYAVFGRFSWKSKDDANESAELQDYAE